MGNIELIGDPNEIKREAAYADAQERLAAILRDTPLEKLGDTSDIDLFQGMRPEFIRMLLLNSDESEYAERDGVMDLGIKAPVYPSTGKILTRKEVAARGPGDKPEIEMTLGEPWSAEVVRQLSPDEHMTALRYAYSCRYRKLDKAIRAGKPNMLVLQERLFALEEHCARAVERIRG